jgi:hypothetical protein
MQFANTIIDRLKIMKRILPMAAIAVMLVTATSCEKKYTCTCVYPNQAVGTTTTDIRAYNKSDARDVCDGMNDGAQARGGACAL